jgi:predicted RNase H-like HicB family nuclease
MNRYLGLIHADAPNVLGVSFPDFPGCVTAASSLTEACQKAQGALTLHLRGMLEDGEVIPAPSAFEEIMGRREAADCVARIVVTPAADRF